MQKKIAIITSIYPSLNITYFKESINSIIDNNQDYLKIFIFYDGIIPAVFEDFIGNITTVEIQVVKSNLNRGLAACMNNLIDLALEQKFEYIARMDTDDIVINDRFEKQLNFLLKNQDIDILGSHCIEFDEYGNEFLKKMPLKHRDLFEMMISRSCLVHPTVMFRSSVFKSGIRYNEELYNMQDYELWSLLFSKGYKFANYDGYLLKFRKDSNFFLRRNGIKRAKKEFKLRKNFLKLNKIESLKNITIISLAASARILPSFALKLLYKTYR